MIHSIRMPGIIRNVLFDLLIPSRTIDVKLFNGMTLECDVRDYRTKELLDTGIYEPLITRLFYSLIMPGATVFDVGANVGYFTLVAAGLTGQRGKVYGFEPILGNCTLLERSRARNDLDTVEILERFCGEYSDAEAVMSLPAVGNTGTGSLAIPKDAATTTVLTIKLDDLCDQRGIGHVDFLKMDIEGGEGVAIRGMQAGLTQHRYKVVAVEFHEQQLETLGESSFALKQMFVEKGYRAYEIVPPSLLVDRTDAGLQGCYMVFLAPGTKFFGEPEIHLGTTLPIHVTDTAE